MTILVSWVNNNRQADQVIRVYRSANEITKDTLPEEPLVEFNSPETFFFDESALSGVMYTYIVEIETAFDKVYSHPIRKQVTFDSMWGDGDDVLVSGDPNLFAYGRDITQGDLPDGILREMLRMVGADQNHNNFVKIVNKGRYFIVPRVAINIDFATMIKNNCLFGHRVFKFAETTDVTKFGNNDYFVYRGRKWRIGMPSISDSPVSVSAVNSAMYSANTPLSLIDPVRGYATSTMTASRPELINLMVNMQFSTSVTHGSSAAVNKEYNNSQQVLTSSLATSGLAAPPLLNISDAQYGTNISFTTTSYTTGTRASAAIPHLEYLGVANA